MSVDESLVLYKGRLKFKQYIRTKRARFGIKLYEICTSNGITLDFMVYCGKGMYDDDDPHEELPYSERIPVVLMQPYMGNGHTLYTDNYYTSPALAVHLLKNKTHLCGTIRNNRKNFAKELIDAQLQKGEAAFYKCDNPNMIACKYRATKDKSTGKQKVVYMLSTCHQPFMEPVNPEATDNIVLKPEAIKCYNKHMGGVDRVDQQLQNFHTLRKTYKWYRKLAFRLITQVILNSHKIYQLHTGSGDTFLQFMHNTIALLVAYIPTIQHNLVKDDTYVRLTGRHFLAMKKAKENAKDQRPTKECRVCSARGKRTDKGKKLKTVYICPDCPSQPGLHPGVFQNLPYTFRLF